MIELKASRGKRPHVIMKRKFRFPAKKEYKFKIDLHDLEPKDVTSDKLTDIVNRKHEWRVTRAQMKNLINAIATSSWLIRYDSDFDGMVDMVCNHENAEFRPMELKDKEGLLDWLEYSRMWVYFDDETREFEIWSLAIGGRTLKLDPDCFDAYWRGEAI